MTYVERALIALCLLVMTGAGFVLLRVSKVSHVSMPSFIAAFDLRDHSVPDPINPADTVIHIWELGDLYINQSSGLSRRRLPRQVNVSQILNWEGKPGQKFAVQVATTPDFGSERIHREADARALNLGQAFLGANFWRVSEDEQRWSKPVGFFVRGVYLDDRVNAWAYPKEVLLEQDMAPVEIRWASTPEITGYVVEVSRVPDFSAVQVIAVNGPTLAYDFSYPGRYYFRARGMNSFRQLTEYSPSIVVDARLKNQF